MTFEGAARRAQRRWQLALILLVASSVLCLGWPLLTGDAAPGSRLIPFPLHSALTADYGSDPHPTRLPPIELDIIQEALKDQQAEATPSASPPSLLLEPTRIPPRPTQIRTGQTGVPPGQTQILSGQTQIAPGQAPTLPPAESLERTETLTPTAALRPTKTPKPTDTLQPTDTPRPTRTPRPTDTLQPTDTPRPTRTPRPTDTLRPTNTPRPTDTPAPTETPKPTKPPKPTDTPIAMARNLRFSPHAL